jgi:twinkle protein
MSTASHSIRLEPISPVRGLLSSTETTPIEPFSVFGWDTVNDQNELCVTDNELDAIAVYQCTGMPAVAMVTIEGLLPLEVINELKKFNNIYFWPSHNSYLISCVAKPVSKFTQCYIINSCYRNNDNSKRGPLEALNRGYDINDIIKNADSMNHKKLLNFRQLNKCVYSEFLNSDKVAGIKWKRFNELTKCLKGFRAGELTILTGPTGSGKTTLMSELSLDLCQQGVSTLWGSFEISNVRLAKILLKQFSGQNLDINLSHYDYWSEKFQKLPFYFMDFHGQVDIKNVIDVMEHSVKFSDVQHVIIDNLQFMIGSSYRGFDESFHAQNSVFAEFRRFATTHGVHVTVIIHPRKEDDEKLLTTASLFGSAKAGQEADNVLILQAQAHKRFLQVTKNRFCGDVGKISLKFDSNSLTFSGFFSESSAPNTEKKIASVVTSKTMKSSVKSSNFMTIKPQIIKPVITSSIGKPLSSSKLFNN